MVSKGKRRAFPRTTKFRPTPVAKREMARIRKVLGLPKLPGAI